MHGTLDYSVSLSIMIACFRYDQACKVFGTCGSRVRSGPQVLLLRTRRCSRPADCALHIIEARLRPDVLPTPPGYACRRGGICWPSCELGCQTCTFKCPANSAGVVGARSFALGKESPHLLAHEDVREPLKSWWRRVHLAPIDRDDASTAADRARGEQPLERVHEVAGVLGLLAVRRAELEAIVARADARAAGGADDNTAERAEQDTAATRLQAVQRRRIAEHRLERSRAFLADASTAEAAEAARVRVMAAAEQEAEAEGPLAKCLRPMLPCLAK